MLGVVVVYVVVVDDVYAIGYDEFFYLNVGFGIDSILMGLALPSYLILSGVSMVCVCGVAAVKWLFWFFVVMMVVRVRSGRFVKLG